MRWTQRRPCPARLPPQSLGLKQQLAPSRRLALPTIPREQRAPMTQQLTAEYLVPRCLSLIYSMAGVHGAQQRGRVSSVCPTRAPTVYCVFIRLGFVEYILAQPYVFLLTPPLPDRQNASTLLLTSLACTSRKMVCLALGSARCDRRPQISFRGADSRC